MMQNRKFVNYVSKQEVRELCIKTDRVIKEADKVSEQHKRIKRAAKEMHHNLKHMDDQDDNDKPIFTPEGKVIVTICFNHAAPKIQRLIDDDSISFEEFKKMDL
jgi:hypothetical protein